MNRNKKQPKTKEPVKVRFKSLANGNYSIYLDTYFEGKRSYEFLRLYLIPETNRLAREQNRLTLQTANVMKAQRIIELANEHFSRRTPGVRPTLLREYLLLYKERCWRTHRGNSFKACCSNMENHLRTYLGGDYDALTLADLDTRRCAGFADYLRHGHTQTGKPLSGVSAYHYFCALKSVLAEAVIDGEIAENPIDKMKRGEVPRRPEVIMAHLDADEVALLAQTACSDENVKRAFLFSCMTGLRLSDIKALRWHNIQHTSRGWRLSIVMQKTQEPLQSKLNDEALAWLPQQRGERGAVVFRLPTVSTIERIIDRWRTAAGIDKHVTFHTARHSYATMALVAGADLYTVSKLLGHRSVTTTTVYAAVVDEKRDAAVDGVSHLFRRQLKKEDG